ILLEGSRSLLRVLLATEPAQGLDRDHLALLRQQALREARLVLARQGERPFGILRERAPGPLEQLRFAFALRRGTRSALGRRSIGRRRFGSRRLGGRFVFRRRRGFRRWRGLRRRRRGRDLLQRRRLRRRRRWLVAPRPEQRQASGDRA